MKNGGMVEWWNGGMVEFNRKGLPSQYSILPIFHYSIFLPLLLFKKRNTFGGVFAHAFFINIYTYPWFF